MIRPSLLWLWAALSLMGHILFLVGMNAHGSFSNFQQNTKTAFAKNGSRLTIEFRNLTKPQDVSAANAGNELLIGKASSDKPSPKVSSASVSQTQTLSQSTSLDSIPASGAQPNEQVRTGVDNAPFLSIDQVDSPAYPRVDWEINPELARLGSGKGIVVRLWIEANGVLSHIELPQEDLLPDLRIAIIELMQKTTFEPAIKFDRPVASYRQLELILDAENGLGR